MAVKNLNLPSFPAFTCSEDVSTLHSSWLRYTKRFQLLCDALVVTESKQKLSMLLTYIGDDAYEIYENIVPQDANPAYSFDQVIEAFNNHFKPQVNTSYETYLFRKMNQRSDETLQQYYIRLHEQAMKCQFSAKDTEIKQQIELSTTSTKLRRYSFQNPDKSLQDILAMAKTFETMKIQTEEIEKDKDVTPTANAVSKSNPRSGKKTLRPRNMTRAQKTC